MARGPSIQSLEERLGAILREIDKLKAKEEVIREMLSEAKGEPKTIVRGPRPNVKQTLFQLLEEVGDRGLNASLAVELAKSRGVSIERATVSSLLSRLKNDGTVSYDNSLYRLKNKSSDPATVTLLRAMPSQS